MFLIKEFQKQESKALASLLNEQFKENGWKEEKERKLEKRVFSCLQAMEETKELTLLLAIEPSNTVFGYILIQWLKELWPDFLEACLSSFYVRQASRLRGAGTHL